MKLIYIIAVLFFSLFYIPISIFLVSQTITSYIAFSTCISILFLIPLIFIWKKKNSNLKFNKIIYGLSALVMLIIEHLIHPNALLKNLLYVLAISTSMIITIRKNYIWKTVFFDRYMFIFFIGIFHTFTFSLFYLLLTIFSISENKTFYTLLDATASTIPNVVHRIIIGIFFSTILSLLFSFTSLKRKKAIISNETSIDEIGTL